MGCVLRLPSPRGDPLLRTRNPSLTTEQCERCIAERIYTQSFTLTLLHHKIDGPGLVARPGLFP